MMGLEEGRRSEAESSTSRDGMHATCQMEDIDKRLKMNILHSFVARLSIYAAHIWYPRSVSVFLLTSHHSLLTPFVKYTTPKMISTSGPFDSGLFFFL